MSCTIHNFGANVWIERGVRIINESTKQESVSDKRLEGTIEKIDKATHKITIRVPEIGNIVVNADKVQKK